MMPCPTPPHAPSRGRSRRVPGGDGRLGVWSALRRSNGAYAPRWRGVALDMAMVTHARPHSSAGRSFWRPTSVACGVSLSLSLCAYWHRMRNRNHLCEYVRSGCIGRVPCTSLSGPLGTAHSRLVACSHLVCGVEHDTQWGYISRRRPVLTVFSLAVLRRGPRSTCALLWASANLRAGEAPLVHVGLRSLGTRLLGRALSAAPRSRRRYSRRVNGDHQVNVPKEDSRHED